MKTELFFRTYPLFLLLIGSISIAGFVFYWQSFATRLINYFTSNSSLIFSEKGVCVFV